MHRCFCEHEFVYTANKLLYVNMSMYTQQINYSKEMEKKYEISNFNPLLCSPDRYRAVLQETHY